MLASFWTAVIGLALQGQAALSGGSAAMAQGVGVSEEGYRAYLPRLRMDAERAGIRRETLDRVFPALTFSPRTIQLDRAQPGGPPGSNANPPFAPYRARHLTQPLIERGRARYAENLGALREISRRTGVPRNS